MTVGVWGWRGKAKQENQRLSSKSQKSYRLLLWGKRNLVKIAHRLILMKWVREGDRENYLLSTSLS